MSTSEDTTPAGQPPKLLDRLGDLLTRRQGRHARSRPAFAGWRRSSTFTGFRPALSLSFSVIHLLPRNGANSNRKKNPEIRRPSINI